jgi:ABC-2 type transport system ATP-binding protein
VEADIEVKGLAKYFNSFPALNHIDLTVYKGEFFGLLGPNGAGKTTLMRILTTLLRPSEGQAKVGGYDVVKDASKVRTIIGAVSDKLIMYNLLSAKENLRFFARLYGLKGNAIEERIDELLDLVELRSWQNKLVGTFSTGMRQRLNIVRALIQNPKILFLDEPTLGLDPQSQRFIKDLVIDLNKKGMTIVLTTHDMDEADELSQRIGIIDRGKIIACDTPSSLKRMQGVGTLEEVFLSLTGRGLRDSANEKVPTVVRHRRMFG